MNVTDLGMICGRSCAPLAFHSAAPRSTRRKTSPSLVTWKVLKVRGRPAVRERSARRSSSGIPSASRPGVMVPSAIAWMRPWPAVADRRGDGRQLLDRGEGAGDDLARARHVAAEPVAREPGGAGVEGLADQPGHLGDLVGGGVVVVVGPLAHHVVAQRPVGDVAGDVGGVAPGVDEVEVLAEGLPLAPRHADRQGAAGDVLDAFHHVDQRARGRRGAPARTRRRSCRGRRW